MRGERTAAPAFAEAQLSGRPPVARAAIRVNHDLDVHVDALVVKRQP